MEKIANEDLGRLTPEEFATAKRMPVVVVLDNVRSANNVGSFFRTADAFGIERLVLCGICATPPSRDIHKSALGAEHTIAWSYDSSCLEAIDALKAQGYTVLAVEQIEKAEKLDAFQPDFSAGRKYALVFGNEVDGVAQAVADHCHGALEVPQAGTKHSLNVAVCGGVVLWDLFVKWRQGF